MSVRGLQKLVGKAVISDNFRKGILGERRAELVGGFDLEPDELVSLLSLRAETLAEFAGAVEEIINNRRSSFSMSHTPELSSLAFERYNLPVAGLPGLE
ncbi:MAG: hypothetical protein HYZ49_02935 [Chloroflexi bacterium]|nr:hypothetical protein [Chloroflexota bacterium]